ncbi:MAG TPA: bifunctional 5,10-methylenetetrahydrofolate dehydrogenase/5,10-methenyltetrahydrofolate cyclohydrolase [Patescibacteria group bacterium]|nr:bifunctional 5,10-methylenetetrahydrofolate dehydrogenase/5,10-methenyltetrahydrofolate cyclohydrolase [Patescibacteria group bacterium]
MTLPDGTGPRLLRGGPIAADVRTTVAADIAEFKASHGYTPELAVVIVGRDAPSTVYLHKILDGCRLVGIQDRLVELGDDCPAEALGREILALGAERTVAGIIVQQPLPAAIPLRVVIDTLDPAKDIDGIHPLNAGLLSLGYDGFLPATAHAAVELLKRSGVELAGRRVVVVGRSNIVGKPAALLLLREHATVTICHSRTPDLAEHLRAADVVVVAAGRPGLVTGEMLKPGAVVVDVGINIVEGRLVGDVDFESAVRVVSAITPVPGGVGPLTNAILLTHLAWAARNQAEGRTAPGAGSLRPSIPTVQPAR